MATAAQVNALVELGVDADILKVLKEWAATRAVVLRFSCEETCTFVKKVERTVESPQRVTEHSGLFTASVASKVVTKVVDYLWRLDVVYCFLVYQGNDPKVNMTLSQKHLSTILTVTDNDKPPHPASSVHPPKEANITWIISHLSSDNSVDFSIDRTRPGCCTPSRNEDVAKSLEFFRELSNWAGSVDFFALTRKQQVGRSSHQTDFVSIVKPSGGGGIFSPVLPLFEEISKNTTESLPSTTTTTPTTPNSIVSISSPSSDAPTSVVLPTSDMNLLLNEQVRRFHEVFSSFSRSLPGGEIVKPIEGKGDGKVDGKVEEEEMGGGDGDGALFCFPLARDCACLFSLVLVARTYASSIDYIENMLWTQLVAAIGKSLEADDFSKYMLYHNRLLLKEEYAPRSFNYAIRRPNCSPEGTVGIDRKVRGSQSSPIQTVVRKFSVKKKSHNVCS